MIASDKLAIKEDKSSENAEQTSTNEILCQALEYHRKGFSVIPLKPGSKEPIIPWEKYQTEKADADRLSTWFLPDGANNVALVTGKVSKIIALDIDGSEAQKYFDEIIIKTKDESIKAATCNTMRIKTGSGNINVVFGFKPEEFRDKELRNGVLWSGRSTHVEIRLKGEGSYLVAPPSVHPTGSRYEMVSDTKAPVVLSKHQILTLFALMDYSNRAMIHLDAQEIEDNNRSAELVGSIVQQLKPYYDHGKRNDFVMYLSGWLRKNGVRIDYARKVIERLAEQDEEKQARLRTLHETFKKEDLDDVNGYAGLHKILMDKLEGDKKKADTIMQQVEVILSAVGKKVQVAVSEKAKKEERTASQVILELVTSSNELFFQDQYGLAHARVTIGNHKEVMAIQSSKFKYYLTKLYYDNTGGKIICQESLNDVIRILTAKALFEGRTQELHLRSHGLRSTKRYTTI